MHPHFYQHWTHHWHAHRMFHRGPSRILWFIIGGVTTAWWMKGHDVRCHRNRTGIEQGVDTYNRRLLDNARNQEPKSDMWEEERLKMRELARQANDAVSAVMFIPCSIPNAHDFSDV